MQKNRWYVIGGLVILIGIGLLAYTHYSKPAAIVADITTFQSGDFTFAYPRTYVAKEYSSGCVSVGQNYQQAGFIPLVDVVSYKPDPNAAAPASFAAFENTELGALCGSDDSIVSVKCTTATATSTYSTGGLKGEDIMMTLTKTNLTTGTTSALMYGPVYVYNVTSTSTPTAYRAVFVYPNFSSFLLVGTTSPAFVDSIGTTIKLSK